ncbi:MAG: hypothetical protein CME64_15065 [Halobacteriovoraceae bacterium]|nr:hypothetical protein [Halobacteriovoraceae bacterium]|tara:strand:+ start:53967 stop:55352 length:1386 start_codon:yes stop_codon:yes gene_type:complete
MITYNEILNLQGIEIKHGELNVSGDECPVVSTDTRTINSGEVFLGIDGERFRPMRFLSKLDDCPLIIYNYTEENEELVRKSNLSSLFLGVKDSIKFLQDISSKVAEKFVNSGGKLIAISGSNGKTTTKEMLFHILKSFEERVVCTQKNNNNHIGVPLSLLQIRPGEKYCILELGSNHPGEIKVLCDIARPNIGITTNIGDTHLEFFNNRKNVFKEEGYLFTAISSSEDQAKLFFKNEDDEFLGTLPNDDFVVNYGESSEGIEIKRSFNEVKVKIGEVSYTLKNKNITGEHNFLNLGLSFGISKMISTVGDNVLIEASQSFVPTTNRSQWISYEGVDIFLDAYNANPSSMQAAILGFKHDSISKNISLEEVLLILGDMNELGQGAATHHEELGKFCKAQGCKNIVFVGNHSKNFNRGFGGNAVEVNSSKEFSKEFKRELSKYKRAFLKGSRSLQLESLVDIN